MTRLGEILMAKGAISTEGLRSALEGCRRQGGRLGSYLLKRGMINETTLLDALSQQTGCQPSTAFELATAPTELRALLPLAFARRHLVVPFAKRGRNLLVAMANPNDLLLIDEIASLTGMVPRPHVATESALNAALTIPTTPETEPTTQTAVERRAPGDWPQFWQLESAPEDLMKGLGALAKMPPPVAAATFPALTSLTLAGRLTTPQQPTDFAEALAGVTHRDHVAQLVLDYLGTVAIRVALFSVHHGKVAGWAVKGPNVVRDDFQALLLPPTRPSVFLNLAKGMDVHIGPLGPEEGNAAIIEALGKPEAREAVVVPLRLRDRTLAFLWVDRGEESASGIPVTVAQDAARLASLALEILLLRQKIRSGARLTDTAGADYGYTP